MSSGSVSPLNIGALISSIGFGGIFYRDYNREPPKPYSYLLRTLHYNLGWGFRGLNRLNLCARTGELPQDQNPEPATLNFKRLKLQKACSPKCSNFKAPSGFEPCLQILTRHEEPTGLIPLALHLPRLQEDIMQGPSYLEEGYWDISQV